MTLPTVTILGGRLTADPELRFVTSGAAVASFTVAANDRKYDKDRNEWTDGDATFVACSVWRDQAERVAEELRKGSLVNVYGKLKQRSYETKEGEKRTVFEVEVEEVSPSLRWKDKQGGGASRGTPQQASQGRQTDPWGASAQTPTADPWGAQTSTDGPSPF